MPWSAVAQAAGDIGSQLAGGFIQTGLADQTYKRAKKMVREHRAWQKRMSNTAIRRRVRDLRKAGINPILAAPGVGASTPSGAVTPVPDYGAAFERGMSSARDFSRVRYQRAQAASAVGLANQQTATSAQNARILGAQASITEGVARAYAANPALYSAKAFNESLNSVPGAIGAVLSSPRVRKFLGLPELKQPGSGAGLQVPNVPQTARQQHQANKQMMDDDKWRESMKRKKRHQPRAGSPLFRRR